MKTSDASVRIDAVTAGRAPLDTRQALPVERLVKPRSIAVVGVSTTPEAIGSVVLANLDRFDYAGEVHLVSRGRSEIAGRACVGTIAELPKGIDLIVLGVPDSAVVESVAACAEREAGAVIVYASGFAEAGEAGQAAQARIRQIAIDSGMLLIGPNCLGLNNFVDGVPLTFGVTQPNPAGPEPTLAVLAQSGGMMANLRLASAARNLKVCYAMSTGNEAVVGIEDCLDFLVDDPQAKVIGLFVEQVRRPALFLSVLAKARRRRKPIVLLHTGRSQGARDAAATHTGALAGDDAVMRTLVRAQGVVLVETIEELADVSWLLTRFAAPPQPREAGAGVITDSGAFKGFALDFCESIGLALPGLAPATVAALQAHLPAFSTASNPLDMTAQGMREADLYANVTREMLADPNIGCVLVCLLPGSPQSGLTKFRSIEPLIRTATKPLVYVMMGGDTPLADELVASVRASGVPFFRSPERAMRAIRYLVEQHASPPPAAAVPGVRRDAAVPLPDGRGTLAEHCGKAWLAALGIAVPQGGLAGNLDEALTTARRIGYPVVLKAQAAALPHKSDVGGVAIGLADDAGLRAAWQQVQASVARARPELVLDGLLVEKMGPRGIEMVLGARRDAQWGPVLMIGLGGVWIEVLQDVRLLPADATVDEIAHEIRQLRGAALLQGARGAEPADIAALAAAAAKVGAAMQAEPRLLEIDINPLVVYPQGRGVLALDCLLVLDEQEPRGQMKP